MATDKLINQTQGDSIITALGQIKSSIDNIDTDAVKPASTSTTENDIMIYGNNAHISKDSGKQIESSLTPGSSGANKIPTSQAVANYVAAVYPKLTYDANGYIAIDYGS